MLELLGYLASILVAISLTMSSILRLRIINLVGSLCFTVYGFLIGSYPVAFVNAFIACVNVYFLTRMATSKEYFRVLEVSPKTEYLRYFIEFNRREIARFLPDFEFEPSDDIIAVFVLRDLTPAGLFLARRGAEGELIVLLDYVIPGYRDFKVGRYLYEHGSLFHRLGIRRLVTGGGTRRHSRYLERVGFVRTEQENFYTRGIA